MKDAVDAARSALIVASYEYEDPGLRRLRAPAQDAEALAGVLSDPQIGDFAVRTLLNEPGHAISEAVEEFFADRRPDDLLLLHFSCHGVKDEGGELYFATTNTKLRLLGATAVGAGFVNRCMSRSRSRRVVLLLDCCYAGAFERGLAARADRGVGIEERFGGRGRAVITASSAMEYAFEGSELADSHQVKPSVFTSALVTGLQTGEADRDQDGYVGSTSSTTTSSTGSGRAPRTRRPASGRSASRESSTSLAGVARSPARRRSRRSCTTRSSTRCRASARRPSMTSSGCWGAGTPAWPSPHAWPSSV